MSTFKKSVVQVASGAVQSFQKFPAAMLSAFAFAIVTMIRIQIDWPQQEAYNFLFNCLHLSFAFGAIFGLAAVAGVKAKYNDKKTFVAANSATLIAAGLAFILLYLFGGTKPDEAYSRIVRVTDVAAARISVAMLISFIAFIVIGGYPREKSDFSKSLFMEHKAFFTALLYGGVLEGGASAVAGAIQGLLYRDMSSKVYMYIATVVGFVAYAIFTGYFPDFAKDAEDEKRDLAQKQPKFIEILLEYILVPIALALTIVLLLWSAKTIVVDEEVRFTRLSGIATSYAFVGIWLHVMVTHYESNLAKFYKKIYPFTALIILAFEARALFIQLNEWGLKTTEYAFILTWIFAVISILLLIVLKDKAHNKIAILICALSIIAVVPVIGYYKLPMTLQVNRLENILVTENILVEGVLIPAKTEPDEATRIKVTDAVSFISGFTDKKLPDWFDKRLGESSVFKKKLGFDQTWPRPDFEPGAYIGTYLYMPSGSIDISSYNWAVNMTGSKAQDVVIEGIKRDYTIYWDMPANRIPVLRIMSGEELILEQDMNIYFDRIIEKYPPGSGMDQNPTFEDMTLKIENQAIEVMLTFSSVSISLDPETDVMSYWAEPYQLYLKEK